MRSAHLDDGAAVLTSVLNLAVVLRFDLLKILAPYAVNLLALGAKAVAQFFLVDREMAVTTAELFALLP